MRVALKTVVLVSLFSTGAFAQVQPEGPLDGTTVAPGEPHPSGTLPPPASDSDPTPPAAAPGAIDGAVVRQAGVGGDVAYGRSGVVEVGGSGNISNSSSQFTIGFNPSIGWFFQDNLEISGIVNLSYVNVSGTGSTTFSLLAEPSYHLPFTDRFFGFLGLGFGLGYQTVGGAGFAFAPRLGTNILVGRSGVLTPALFGNYSTVRISRTGSGTNVQLNFSYGLQIGYTVML
jgi:hypothetical protein